jgi:preprotein translocase subunit SecE
MSMCILRVSLNDATEILNSFFVVLNHLVGFSSFVYIADV